MISFNLSGNFNKTDSFLKKMKSENFMSILNKYGKQGVDALAKATPTDSGKTASSWDYEIRTSNSGAEIYWTNSNINKGVNIAIIIQYGHGTRNGGYVAAYDYINPAMKPIFNKIADDIWREVRSS